MNPENCIKVKRDGPRGWHWIKAADFDPAVHEPVGDVQASATSSAVKRRTHRK